MIEIGENNKQTEKTATTRPSSARFTSKYINNEKSEIEKEKGVYKALNDEHKQHKDEIKKSQQEGIEYLNKGTFHQVYKAGKDTVVFEDINKNTNYLNSFNNAFIPALLEVCGERTIPIGLTKDKKQYSKLAANDLFEICKLVFYEDNNRLTDVGKYIKAVTLFSRALTNDIADFLKGKRPNLNNIDDVIKIYKTLPDHIKPDVIAFCSRYLFKLFLFQIYDRKAENMLVLKETDENGLPIIVESDFDDFKDIDCIFGKLKLSKFIGNKQYLLNSQKNLLDYLYNLYLSFNGEHLRDAQAYKKKDYQDFFIELEKECHIMSHKYMITKEKMAKLIELTTMKAKYLGFNEKEIINGIKSKIKDWKAMLQKKTTGNIVNKMAFIKEARDVTSEALNKINNKDLNEYIARIVKGTKAFQDIATKKYCKEEDDILYKKHNNVKRDDILYKLEQANKSKQKCK